MVVGDLLARGRLVFMDHHALAGCFDKIRRSVVGAGEDSQRNALLVLVLGGHVGYWRSHLRTNDALPRDVTRHGCSARLYYGGRNDGAAHLRGAVTTDH